MMQGVIHLCSEQGLLSSIDNESRRGSQRLVVA